MGRWEEGHANDLIALCLARDDSPQHGRANIQRVGSNTYAHTHTCKSTSPALQSGRFETLHKHGSFADMCDM